MVEIAAQASTGSMGSQTVSGFGSSMEHRPTSAPVAGATIDMTSWSPRMNCGNVVRAG